MRQKSDKDWFGKTDIICLGDWAKQYLDYAQAGFAEKTYLEKRLAFKLLFQSIDPTSFVESLTPAIMLRHLQKQMKNRSGNAANKDRKNLVAAWHWGMKYMDPTLPSPNPCLVKKMPENRTPRYVPPEEDFWKVYNQAKGQDRIMLLAYLHLAHVPHPTPTIYLSFFSHPIYPSKSASDKFNAFRYRFCPSVSGAVNRHMPATLTT